MFAELNKSICKVCKKGFVMKPNNRKIQKHTCGMCGYKKEDQIKALEHEMLFVYHGI